MTAVMGTARIMPVTPQIEPHMRMASISATGWREVASPMSHGSSTSFENEPKSSGRKKAVATCSPEYLRRRDGRWGGVGGGGGGAAWVVGGGRGRTSGLARRGAWAGTRR